MTYHLSDYLPMWLIENKSLISFCFSWIVVKGIRILIKDYSWKGLFAQLCVACTCEVGASLILIAAFAVSLTFIALQLEPFIKKLKRKEPPKWL